MPKRRQLEGPPPGWHRGPIPARRARCYRSKSEALRVFADRNRAVIDRWGGLTIKAGPSEFDAINHSQDRRGRRAVRTIEQALFAVLPTPCLDSLDLGLLNRTSPASERPFELPDHVIDVVQEREQRRRWAAEKRAAGPKVSKREQERRDREAWDKNPLFGRSRRRR